VLNVIADFTDPQHHHQRHGDREITLRLKDVPWDQAPRDHPADARLDSRRSGNVVWIAAATSCTPREARARVGAADNDLEQTRTESFQMSYQKRPTCRSCSPTRPAHPLQARQRRVDARTNTRSCRTRPAAWEEVRRLLAKIDVAVRR